MKHQHGCARCRRHYDCSRGDNCAREKKSLCGKCFNIVAAESEEEAASRDPGFSLAELRAAREMAPELAECLSRAEAAAWGE